MRNLWLGTVLATLVGVLPAAAQETPKVEVSANYSFIHTRLVPSGGCCFNMHGGSFSIAANLNRTVSLVGDFGAYRANNVKSSGFNLHVVTYMFGPRFNIRRHESLNLFGQALFGGGHAGGSLYTGGSPFGPQNSFSMALGGGLDVKLHKHVAVRVVQAEWLFTKFANGVNSRQNNLRLSGGIVFRFGSK